MKNMLLVFLVAVILAIVSLKLLDKLIIIGRNKLQPGQFKLFDQAYSVVGNIKNREYGVTFLIAITSGILVAILSPLFSRYYNDTITKENAIKNMSNLHIGISRSKVEEYLGVPVVNDRFLGNYNVDMDNDGKTDEWEFVSAGYVVDDNVVLCMYRESTLEAYFVICSSSQIYKINPLNNQMLHGEEQYIGEFTYNDFSKEMNNNVSKCYCMDGRPPYYYYYEVYYGNISTLEQCAVIGTFGEWESFNSNETIYELIDRGIDWCSYFNPQMYARESALSQEERETRLSDIRKKAKPNMYGVINTTISDDFQFASDMVGNLQNYSLLFGK